MSVGFDHKCKGRNNLINQFNVNLMNRLRIGVTERIDAGLDQTWREHVDEFDLVVLITKAPQLLDPSTIPGNAIVHCTITGHGGTPIEPGVASTDVTLPAYAALIRTIGPERTVLRIDPILVTEEGEWLAQYVARSKAGRLRVSFLDMYPHVKARFLAAGKEMHDQFNLELPQKDFHSDLVRRQQILSRLPKDTEVCCEPGILCTGCAQLRDLSAIGVNRYLLTKGTGRQRADCGCLIEKTELLGNIQRKPCPHGCLYCYWKG